MNSVLIIDKAGLRKDGCYLGGLSIFWIIWTPVTVCATVIAFSDFSFFWLVWLVFGYVGVLGIPYMLLDSMKPHKFEATTYSLIIRGTGIPFARVIDIPRSQPIKIHLGHYDDESVVTLNIFSGVSAWTRRIMIAPLSHPMEKRRIFGELQTFLSENNFEVHVEDDHPKTRCEEDE